MSGSQRRHHRRRTGSTARRYRPSELVPIDARRHRVGVPERLAMLGVAIVAVTLIALVWIVTGRATQEERAEFRQHAEQKLTSNAAVLADQVRHELLMIDQSISIIQGAWKRDSDTVDLARWQKTMIGLTSVASDIFIADDKHVIQQDILPSAIGQGIGAAYLTVSQGSLETFNSDGDRNNHGYLEIGQTSTPIDGREFLIYVVRPLDHPKGWLVGASYQSDQLPKLFAEADLGDDGIAALVDAKFGGVESIIGPAARRPVTNVTNTPMFDGITKNEAGIWQGTTAIDGVERLLAYHKVPGRTLIALVATPLSRVMALADDVASAYRSIAALATLLIAAIAGLMMWGLYNLRRNSRRRRMFDRSQTDLVAAQTDLASFKARSALMSMQLQSLVGGLSDGIAVLDADFCLTVWNPTFAAAARLDASALQAGLSIDELLRRQATAGAFGPLDNPEAEVAQRVAVIRSERDKADLTQFGPEDETIALRCRGMPDGGLILILGGLLHWQPAPDVTIVNEQTEESAPAGAAVIEW